MKRFFFLESFMIPWHYSEYGVWRGVWVGPAGSHAQVRVDRLQGPVYIVLQFVHLLRLSTCRGKQALEPCGWSIFVAHAQVRIDRLQGPVYKVVRSSAQTFYLQGVNKQ